MYAIRIYKNFNTKRTIGIRIVNENTLEYSDFSIQDIKKMLLIDPRSVANLEFDSRNTPRLKNYNPEQKQKYYRQTFERGRIINHYCIITGFSNGMLNIIADTYDENIIYCSGVTLGEIAAELSETDISKLKFYNASMKRINNKPFLIVYDNNGKHKVEIVNNIEINSPFGKNWEVQINRVTQEGISIASIENIAGEVEAAIPNCVSSIGRFDGGVNILKLPASVHYLGEGCFEDIEDLLELKLGDGIRVIPKGCCRNTSLKKVTLPRFLEEIDDEAFEDSHWLSSAIVTTAKRIGKRAFCGTSISMVSLDGTEIIDIEAFAYNSKLCKVKLYEGLKEIMGGAFRNCDKIKEIKFPESLEKIHKLAFSDCSKLKVAYIHKGTLVSKSAFPKSTKIVYY